ncbi:MAG: hypothetical protein MRZ28_05460 [Oscillospiraceae bacterium]|nr:hypothetical protein [Oscillospiraceae bacterium]MCM0706102.1 hypothetical protein [Faecalicatena sp. BF-R-105]MDY3219725.1 hypothetical protein [Candidatus Fimivivens sp.]SFI76384.1 hypothetical protein SAMN02910435_00735 [Ruminococcaceae bacterium D5]GKH51286.1 hypothetical protein CE91St46_23970 [Eubacteriales bacterium]
MKTVFTLTSAESRRLIAKAVVAMPEFKKAWESAYLLLAGGTTNAFIAQELLGRDGIEPGRCTVGISTDGLLCVTNPDSRKSFPNVFYKGEKSDKTLVEALADFHAETVVIKGANAVDMNGYVGIITSGFDGGTVPRIIGPVTSKGLKFITPVGLEKLVPSVQASAKALGGATHIDISMGADPGMYCIGTSTIVTEIEAIRMLFNADATLVCCGGVGGNEGAVTLAVDGDEKDIKALVEFLETEIKGEPPVKGNKGICEVCRYKFCRYCGKKAEELPAWMKK